MERVIAVNGHGRVKQILYSPLLIMMLKVLVLSLFVQLVISVGPPETSVNSEWRWAYFTHATRSLLILLPNTNLTVVRS